MHHSAEPIAAPVPTFPAYLHSTWRGLISHRHPSMELLFVCLAFHDLEFVDGPAVSTAGYVKLLLPPRQSRGNSHWGLVWGRVSRVGSRVGTWVLLYRCP